MEQQKVKIEVSKLLTDQNTIRIPKRARDLLRVQYGSSLEAWASPFKDSSLVTVKQAFKEDLKNIPLEDRDSTIFISQHTYDTFSSNRGRELLKELNIADKRETCIGSDPEFAIYNMDEQLIYAADHLDFNDKIGSDGPLAELRAEPGITAKEHVDNLETLILDIKNKIDLRTHICIIEPFAEVPMLRSGVYEPEDTYTLSCGGHIHFGLTKKLSSMYAYPMLLINILDRTIGMCLHRLDGDLGSIRRLSCNYGCIPDYRDSEQRLEWRSPTGTWLMYKDLAEIVLSVTNALIEKVTWKLINNLDYLDKKFKGYNDIDTVIYELFPSLVRVTEDCEYDAALSDMISGSPADKDFEKHIILALEALDEMIDIPLFEQFAQLMQGEPNQYYNFNPHFIENWTNKVSVFDHLKI